MNDNDTASIRVTGLTKRFGNFAAVDGITFEVKPGEIFGFLGANGAGKTTAMRMLCGLLRPTSGTGTVAGYDIYTQRDDIKRNIGYMSQKFSLYPKLKVWENIRLFGGIYGLSGGLLKEKTDAILEELDMLGEKDTSVEELPLGWKQKLAFSTATLHRPQIVFLDEPTGGVDPATRRPAAYWRAVTVLCADSGLADALSTALFTLPQAEGQALLDRYGAEAMWVDASGGEVFSPGFSAYLRT